MTRTVEPTTDQWHRHVYVDDLPACPLAPSGERFEAVGVTSQLSPLKGDFADHAAKTVAAWAVEHRHVWENLKPDQAVTLIAAERKRALESAANRGVDLHNAVEAYAKGQQMLSVLDPNAAAYLPAVERFVEECRPEFLWSEIAVFNRAHGYAGKNDSVLRLGGWPGLGVRFVDWKSRARAAVYDTEAPQLAAYSHAEYGIIDDRRVPLPEHDGGLVVVFTPDGYELFPVDLEQAWPVFLAAQHLYQIRGDARRAVGSALVRGALPTIVEPAGTPVVGRPERRAWLRTRIDALKAGYPAAIADLAARWPLDLPTLAQSEDHDDAQLDAIAALISAVAGEHDIPFEAEPPRPAVDVEALRARLDALPPDLGAAVEAEARAQGVPNMLSALLTGVQIAIVDDLLTRAENDAQTRRGYIASLLSAWDDDVIDAFMGEIAVPELERYTAADVERLEVLCAALDAAVIGLSWDGETPVLIGTPQAEVALLRAHGSRSAVLAAVKKTADRIGCAKPRSMAQAVANPVLVAASFSN